MKQRPLFLTQESNDFCQYPRNCGNLIVSLLIPNTFIILNMGSSLSLERVHFLYGHKHHTTTHVFTQFSSKKNDIYIVPIISLIIYHLNGWIVFHNIIGCGICKYSPIDKHLAFSFLSSTSDPACLLQPSRMSLSLPPNHCHISPVLSNQKTCLIAPRSIETLVYYLTTHFSFSEFYHSI